MKKEEIRVKKPFKFLSAAMATILLATSIVIPASAKTAPIIDNTLSTGKFNIICEPFDYGIDVTKLLVNVGTPIAYNSINGDTFTVQAKVYTPDTHKVVFPDLNVPDDYSPTTADDASNPNGDRYVTDTYVCDKDGNRITNGSSNYVMICLTHGVQQTSSTDYKSINGAKAAFYETMFYTPMDLQYTVKQAKPITGISSTLTLAQNKIVDPAVDCWDKGSLDGINYRAYAPDKDGKKHPLLIWLHGMGEGGATEGIQIMGNRVTAFSSPDGQKALDNAYVLAPQCPFVWPDQFNFTAKSKYIPAVQDIIDTYMKNHPDIDTNRIYIGGLSMGGYMAWQMILSKPSMYAGAVIASAAYSPTVEDLQKVKDLPLWIVYCDTDNVCIPSQFSAKTIERLKGINATKFHYSEYAQVFTDGIRYGGHSAWNYIYHNACTDDLGKTDLHVLNWLSAQTKAPAVTPIPATASSITNTTSSTSLSTNSSSLNTAAANAKTGDSTTPIVYVSLLGVTLLSAAAFVIGKKKKSLQK